MLPRPAPRPTDPVRASRPSRERAGVRVVALGPGHECASRAGTRTPYTLDFAGADGEKNAH
jgi:hypothetical protein